MKPYSDTAEENKTLVFPVIKPYLEGVSTALEIASGTGQQIVFFAEMTPEIIWQPTDLPDNVPGIVQWVDNAGLQNVLPPVVLDVGATDWPVNTIEFAYSSNSLHIMSWQHVLDLFARLGGLMKTDAYFCVYGPFSFAGKHVSDSNVRFDSYLKHKDPLSGVRDTEALEKLGESHGIILRSNIDMPHNNHILVWQKVAEIT